MIKLETVCEVAKTFTAKADTDESGAPTTTAKLKVRDLRIDRDTIDELLGEPIGWCQSALFDEAGAPRRRYGIMVFGRAMRVSGTISGPQGQPTLSLLQAELSDVRLTLIPLGALVEGTLTWAARGDEVEDCADLLGKLCAALWEITDGGQADMFDPTSRAGAAANSETARIISQIGRTPPGAER
ncbi:MAG: hypothetical protein ACP5P4_15120 [Steroidobacteraceae bacterium]